MNPELELLRFLTARGFPHIAALAGWYEVEGATSARRSGILQEFLAGARDGWELTLDELATDPAACWTAWRHSASSSASSTRRWLRQLRPGLRARRAVAEALSILYADVDEQIERVFLDLPESEATAPIPAAARTCARSSRALARDGRRARDPHPRRPAPRPDDALPRGWVVLDFEGEPARPLPERRLKRSPLRDVAGMLRSFSYVTAGAGCCAASRRRTGWEERARERFLAGYHRLWTTPCCRPGQQATEQLLAVFELEKAVYELRYELNNRPDWVAIPVAGILRAPGFGVNETTMSEADQLISRQHANPHGYLGAHPENGSVVIRTFRPAAAKVEVVDAGRHPRGARAGPPRRRLRGPHQGREAAARLHSSRSTTASPARSRSRTRTGSCRRSASSTSTCSARAATRSCGSAWART